MNYFAKTIKETREALGYTQAQLAEFVGVSDSYIAKVEAGDTYPNEALATKIASAIGWNEDLPEFLSYVGIYNNKALQQVARESDNIAMLLHMFAHGKLTDDDAHDFLAYQAIKEQNKEYDASE